MRCSALVLQALRPAKQRNGAHDAYERTADRGHGHCRIAHTRKHPRTSRRRRTELLPGPAVPRGAAERPRSGAGTVERRIRITNVGDGRQPRRRRLRRGVHGRRSRRPVAGQPGHLGAEGQHGQRLQPARARAVDGEPLFGRAAGRQPLRAAGEQPRRHRRRVRRQPGQQRPEQRSDGRRAHRRRQRVRRRARALQRQRTSRRRHRRQRRLVVRGSQHRVADAQHAEPRPRARRASAPTPPARTTSSTTSRRSPVRCRASAPAAGAIPCARTPRR